MLDVKIFALAILLSSFLVYNSLGTIDDNAMDNISLLIELTRKIKMSGREGDETPPDPYELTMFFPRFLWLLRDFALELRIDGEEITPEQYLENALKPLAGNSEDIQTKNRTRECVRTFFRDRTCMTLRRPVEDEEQLHELES
ncbi:hypothetical protein HK102_010801, partial [Quaeritorhiza haematococci]